MIVPDTRAVYEQSQGAIEMGIYLFGTDDQLQDGALFHSVEQPPTNSHLLIENAAALQLDGSKKGLTWGLMHALVIGLAQYMVPDVYNPPSSVVSLSFVTLPRQKSALTPLFTPKPVIFLGSLTFFLGHKIF